MALRLEAYAVNCAIYFGYAENLFDLLRERAAIFEVDRFTTDGTRVRESRLVHIAHDDDCGAEQLRRRGGRKTDWSCPRDVALLSRDPPPP